MDRYGKPSSLQRGTLAAPGLLCSMLLCSAPATPAADPPLRLRPAGVEASQGSLRVTLVNDGALAVRAFCMTSRSGPVETAEDLPPRPPLVAAGGVKVVTLRTQPVPADDLDAEVRSFAVTCVQWEDGSVEGRPGHVALLLQGQAGTAFEWKRLLPKFEQIQHCADAEWSAALAGAARWIADGGDKLDDGTQAAGSFEGGMEEANLAAKMTLDSLQRLSVDPAGMTAAREHLADMVSRWRTAGDFLSRVKGLSADGADPKK
jgi:hypothetical protein